MNLIPLNSTGPVSNNDDGLLIVNFDHVYCIAANRYWPDASPGGVEGSRLYIAGQSSGHRPYTLEVAETRAQILRLLEGPGRFSVSNQKQKSADTFP